MKEISKTYNPNESELKLIDYWQKHNFFAPEENSSKPKYSIVIPPPNITGNLTVGHMLNNTIQDVYSRWKRMSGYNVLWLPGADHAGIATQTAVEKKLREQKITRHDLGREKFVEKMWEWKDIYHTNIVQQLTRMGASVDWSRERFTMDEGLSHAVNKVFVALYKKGLIYKGKRIINWDPLAETAISDEEVLYQERRDKLYYFKYPVIGEEGKYVTIATTRPETMLGDTAVAVNPEDPRYTGIAGKKVMLPIVQKPIPVIADSYVDIEFGTGALKITPAHDPNDFTIGEKYNLELVQVIDQKGKMNELAGKYAGLDRFEARKKIVEEMESLGLVEKIEDYVHNVGISERGGTVVEPYLSDQWFVSMKSLAGPALEAVTSGKIRFHPERWEKVYEHWMNNIRDWCISRQLWWGHQIPVWYNKTDGSIYCETHPPEDIENWERDPDVLDTWFSSWLWPFSTMGWPDSTKDVDKYFPTDFLSTAPDIIFFWVARMIMASLEFTGKIPFDDVYFHNIIRDEKGRKMSKSLGNSPDVIEVMNEYGTDALRFTLLYLAPQGVDVFFSVDKCEVGRNFANKIWNASRFLQMKRAQSEETAEKGIEYKQDAFDRWIVSRFNSALKQYIKALEQFKINEASSALYDFLWRDFCDWYIEIMKVKTINSPGAAELIVNNAIEIFLKAMQVLHPIMPFITEELWSAMSLQERKEDESITVSEFPKLDEALISSELEREFEIFQQFITAIRNLRSEMNLNPSVKCDVVINCTDPAEKKFLEEAEAYVKSLAKIGELVITMPEEFAAMEKFKSVSAVVGPYQVYMKTAGLIDVEQEKAKAQKEIERAEQFLVSVSKKLSNEKFLEKASEEVISNERKKQEDTLSKLEKLRNHLKSIESEI